jgi:hypothetical protein
MSPGAKMHRRVPQRLSLEAGPAHQISPEFGGGMIVSLYLPPAGVLVFGAGFA